MATQQHFRELDWYYDKKDIAELMQVAKVPLDHLESIALKLKAIAESDETIDVYHVGRFLDLLWKLNRTARVLCGEQISTLTQEEEDRFTALLGAK